MNTCEARWIFLPYCLYRLKDGRYIVLNRKYKPLGVRSSDWVVYEDHPSAASMKITPEIAKKLSWQGSDNLDVIHLYNDASIPNKGEEHLQAYANRLKVLMDLAVETD